jgi:predicted nucleic acid-binding protein
VKRFFVDTNILLDFLADRKPFSDQAELLFEYAQEEKVGLYVSAISFNNLYYIIRKRKDHRTAIRLLKELSELVSIITLDEDMLKRALNSDFTDFEDAIQYFSALRLHEIEGIITRNSKDFKHSSLAILSPEIALKIIADE